MSLNIRSLERWFLKFCSFLIGCFTCFLLQSQLNFSTVLAAAVTGFVGSYLPDTKKISRVHIHANIYMGAFVAMGSKAVAAGPLLLVLVSVLGSGIYFLGARFFNGLGGRLGFIAFISSLLSLLIAGSL